MQFTRNQREAIEHKAGNLQLIACAGSGKTEVVARRVANLLDPNGGALSPRNIIAFTFTEKAAAELKERIHERCRTQGLFRTRRGGSRRRSRDAFLAARSARPQGDGRGEREERRRGAGDPQGRSAV
ncbi:MAG: UvrD-helicase domain-containing protein [Chromatiales bacterium]